MINDDNADEEYAGPDNHEVTDYDDLSEVELLEIEEELVQELRKGGLLRPALVKPGARDPKPDAPETFLHGWPETF